MTDPTLFDYTIIRKSRLRHLYLHIREGNITVTANKAVSEHYIQQFVTSKATWIHKQLLHTKQRILLTDNNAMIYILGKSLPIEIMQEAIHTKEEMVIENHRCLFYVKHIPTHEGLQILRDRYYKDQCSIIITPIVEQYAHAMHLYPEKITYRHNRSRWGSCSNRNNISLNTRLMILPLSMITYIVIHELAHIKHKNHSSSFWAQVETFSPNYKELRSGLRGFESVL